MSELFLLVLLSPVPTHSAVSSLLSLLFLVQIVTLCCELFPLSRFVPPREARSLFSLPLRLLSTSPYPYPYDKFSRNFLCLIARCKRACRFFCWVHYSSEFMRTQQLVHTNSFSYVVGLFSAINAINGLSLYLYPQSMILRRKGSSKKIMEELKVKQKSLRRSVNRDPYT